MNTGKPKSEKRASVDYAAKWNNINWTIVEQVVNRLQSRIAKAARAGRYNLVKILQYLLTRSYHAKLLAVKKVITNKGKRTAGVDGKLWDTAEKKYKGVLTLSNKGYKAVPLKRTYIKKANGKQRPLGIPTMVDRAMQALYALSLDPVAETILSKPTFGFRKHRSGKDAASYIYTCMSQKTCATWVLEGDIKSCFDEISHQWLLDHIPMSKRILKQFLKAGYIYKKDLYPTNDGTPQGGIISPILANLTLNGLTELLAQKYSANSRGTISRKHNINKIHAIVYADDFIITASNEEILHQVKHDIETFLQVRGLTLSKEKTIITHINNGFDFLGWTFRKFNHKLIITPSKKSVKRLCKNIQECVRTNIMQKQEGLIKELNQIIRGWCNYHKNVCAKSTFQKIDNFIFETIWRWTKRRHPTKSKGWRKNKYFTQTQTRDWIFESGKNKLIFASDTKIIRHVLIKLEAHPYLKEFDSYYRERKTSCLLTYNKGQLLTT